MKRGGSFSSNRFAAGKILRAAVLCAAMLLLLGSCDRMFIPGDVPDGPSALTLTSEAGERTAEPLSYFWEKTKTETRTELDGPDPRSAEYDPLVVQPGEKLLFTFADQNAPKIMNVAFLGSDGNGGFLEKVYLSPTEEKGDSGSEYYSYSAPSEDGLLIVEALWPSWINSGISAEATYAFYVWSAKG